MRFALPLIVALALAPASAQQVADSSFDASVAHPAFADRHPLVVVDAAHRNFHTIDGRYQPFAALLRADGLRVQPGTSRWNAASLRGTDVLVVANALGAGANARTDASPPAFTDAESDAVRDWVRGGGALLLIADHTPFGTAARALASRFGINFGEGFVLDTAHSFMRAPVGPGQARPPGAGTLLEFTRAAGLGGTHFILEGRDPTERIDRVLTFTGQSMTVPAGATPLLVLSSTAREARTRADLQQDRTEVPRGTVQGLAMTFGRGRVVALGEAAMMSAQLAGPANGPQPRLQMGMNHPGSDDKQFALNVVRWLAGLEPPAPVTRIMSYNIQYGGGGKKLDSVIATIRSAHPDIVGLQEVDVHWSERSDFEDQAGRLAEALGLQVRFAPIYDFPDSDGTRPHRQFGVAVLSRYPITRFANDSLTRHSTQDSTATPGRQPGLLDVTIDVRGTPVRVLDTHLDYRRDPAVRRQQVAEMVEQIGKVASPTLLLGDLNAPPDAPELQPLFAALRDSWAASFGDGFTIPSANPAKRIDYVLVSGGIRVRKAWVPASTASDHRPMVVDLIVR